MRILILILAFLLLVAVSNNQASVAMNPETPLAAREREKAQMKQKMKELESVERRKQLPAIAATFAKHTSRERADRLTYLCYEATIDTPFKPIDLAELALAETGGHALSGAAVSREGALGVWQLMPKRARSHGYTPQDMKKDEKCAEAAVRELAVKLEVADGNLAKAKRLYCGAGEQARRYEVKIRKYRKEILSRMEKQQS